MKIAIIGHSNSILLDGWTKAFKSKRPNDEIVNISVGGSLSPALLSQVLINKELLADCTHAIIEPCVIDSHFKDADTLSYWVRLLFIELSSASIKPVLLILPRLVEHIREWPDSTKAWIHECNLAGGLIIDGGQIIAEAAKRTGFPLSDFWRDSNGHHISSMGQMIGETVADQFERPIVPKASLAQEPYTEFSRPRVFSPAFIAKTNSLEVTHRSSRLAESDCAQLTDQDVLFPIEPGESIAALLFNVGEVDTSKPILYEWVTGEGKPIHRVDVSNRNIPPKQGKLTLYYPMVNSHGLKVLRLKKCEENARIIDRQETVELAGALVTGQVVPLRSWREAGLATGGDIDAATSKTLENHLANIRTEIEFKKKPPNEMTSPQSRLTDQLIAFADLKPVTIHSREELEAAIRNKTTAYYQAAPAEHWAFKPEMIKSNKIDLAKYPVMAHFLSTDFKCPELGFLILHDVEVVVGVGQVIVNKTQLLKDMVPLWNAPNVRQFIESPRFGYALNRPPVSVEGVRVLAFGVAHSNYGHWHHDYLSSFAATTAFFGEDYRYIIPEAATAFNLASLDALGIKPGNLDRHVDHVVHVPTLIIPTRALGQLTPNQHYVRVFDQLRLGVWNKLGIESVNPLLNRKIYVARFDANARGMTNERELADALEKEGFEILTPGGLNYLQQVKTFSEASIVIGQHGAGLINAGYMFPGGRLIEIHPVPWGVPTFSRMALARGIKYFAYFKEADEGSGQNMKYKVDVPDFVRQLRTWLYE